MALNKKKTEESKKIENILRAAAGEIKVETTTTDTVKKLEEAVNNTKENIKKEQVSVANVEVSPIIKKAEKPDKKKRSVGRPKLSEVEKERLTVYVEPELREQINIYSKFQGGLSEYITKLVLKDIEVNKEMYNTLLKNLK